MPRDGLAYVTSFDLNYIQGGMVLLGSLAKQVSSGQVVYVLTSNNALKIQENLDNLDCLKRIDVRVIDVPSKISLESSMSMDGILHFSNAAIFRLFIPILFPVEVTHVIYLDSDMLILDSLEELEENFDDFSAVLESNKAGYFNSGVFKTSLDIWRKENAIEQFQIFLKTNPHSVYKDQDALNFVFSSRNSALNPKFNCQIKDKNSPKEAVILHYSGTRKPWYASTPNTKYIKLWRVNAKEFLGNNYQLQKREFDFSRRIFLYIQICFSVITTRHRFRKREIECSGHI